VELCSVTKEPAVRKETKFPFLISKYFTPLFVWDVIMCTNDFADGIYFSKEFYASICNLDWFPKDADSFFVQHSGTYLTNYRVSHLRGWSFDIHSWNDFNPRL